MKKIVTKRAASIVLVLSLLFLIAYHLLILFRVLPFTASWGGQANENNFLFLELFAISLTFFFLLITLSISEILKNSTFRKISAVGIWVMIVYFSFNIVGNIFAKTLFEKLIFTPLSVLMALASIRLVVKE